MGGNPQLISLSFSFLLILSGFRLAAQSVDGIAAIVNDKVITFSEVRRQVEPTERILKESYSGPQLVERIKEARLSALRALIERELIIQNFKKEGYIIPDHVIEERLREIIRTQFEGDRLTMIRTLQANGMTIDQYKEDLKNQIIIQAMRAKNVPSQVVISPYQVERYYQEHIQQFTEDPQVKLWLIFIKKSVPPEDPLDSPSGPAPPDPALQRAQEILFRLKTGEDFAELARQYSEGPKQDAGGDMGWVTRDTLRKEVADVVFSLHPGQLSEVIPTDDGYYIAMVEDVKPAKVQPLSEVRKDIEKTLVQEERQKLQEKWLNKLRAKAFIKMF
ncbi:peptidylprolyl isomerase [Candidatus Methylacidithermus pantelleriae]|uniref:peptidylprolyl isomerase n=1 Tax=Candidatus Methylacidithermus pantelleriae TaxID=2744239 RepID=A0A8J2FRF0_9BACT|nr:peptidylprolyl isomerase [Candidatus Methylacidithermus pantelleriae]CAF0689805.1 Survival protein SurA precursor (Peptidyl-prolyl cis-trans isomerase SurA) [Candidatus Methylacidithermus pantelleriae]